MDEHLLLKVGVTVLGLVIFGIALTAYEFREHIVEKLKRRKKKK